MKQPPFDRSSRFVKYFHLRYGVPHHTETGKRIHHGDIIDDVTYLINPGEVKVVLKDNTTFGFSVAIAPMVAFSELDVKLEKYRADSWGPAHTINQLGKFVDTISVVGFNSEISNLLGRIYPENINKLRLTKIDDWATVDEYREVVRSMEHNKLGTPIFFLGCLLDCVGDAVNSVYEKETEHYIYVR